MSLPMIEAGKQTLTASRLRAFDKCRHYHYLRYELGVVPVRESEPLRVGTMFHNAMEEFDRCGEAELVEGCIRYSYKDVPEWISDSRELRNWKAECEMVIALFYGHVRHYANDGYRALETEGTFTVPIKNPATGFCTPVFQRSGKRDRIVMLPDGRIALQEYKTTSSDISTGSDYWLKLRIDNQISGYYAAMDKCDTISYDVTRRPSFKPLNATPEEHRKFTKEGKLYANLREFDETAEEYGARVDADIQARPDWYFQRKEIARSTDDIRRFNEELWMKQKLIRECQNSSTWDRNPDACIRFGRCEYFGICSSCINLKSGDFPPDGFKIIADVHPELTQTDSD